VFGLGKCCILDRLATGEAAGLVTRVRLVERGRAILALVVTGGRLRLVDRLLFAASDARGVRLADLPFVGVTGGRRIWLADLAGLPASAARVRLCERLRLLLRGLGLGLGRVIPIDLAEAPRGAFDLPRRGAFSRLLLELLL
jgi:hypothetical protein